MKSQAPSRRVPASAFFALTCSISLFSCASKDPAPPLALNQPVTPGPTCAAPFNLEEPGLTPLNRYSAFPKGRYRLTGMQVFVAGNHGEKVLASSQEADDFEVRIDCTDLGAAAPTNRSAPILASFHISDILDTRSLEPGDRHREMLVKVAHGKVTGGSSYREPMERSERHREHEDRIPQERIEINPGNHLTERLYALPNGNVEARLKSESLAEDGGVIIQLNRAVFEPIR